MIDPIITEQAQADLDESWDYLSVRSLAAADRLIDRFLEAARIHARFPESGRLREEIAEELRSFVVSPYVAFYRPVGGTIEVVRFLHGRRDIERILRDDPP
ncbi:type II toxin-antitoxin system RelE/ParE family toxin [soil metagenome]